MVAERPSIIQSLKLGEEPNFTGDGGASYRAYDHGGGAYAYDPPAAAAAAASGSCSSGSFHDDDDDDHPPAAGTC